MSANYVKRGDVVTATVISIQDKGAVLEIPGMVGVDGHIYDNEFSLDSNVTIKNTLKVGDKLDVQVQKVELDENNYILVSRLPLLKKENKEKVLNAYKNKEVINVKVVKAVNKGVIAKYLDAEIFIHESQLELGNVTDLNSYVGKELAVKISSIEEVKGKEKISASRKVILKDELNAAKAKELDNINKGDIVFGTVLSFEKFGILVNLGLNNGLLRFSQVSHHRNEKPESVLKVGEKVQLKVLAKEGNKIDLSRKALMVTPFEEYVKAHKVSMEVVGKVINKLAFGLILELAEDVTGLLHQNEYSWNPNDNLANCVKIGDEIKVAITSIDHKNEKISLSKKALEDNPWSRVTANKGDILDVKVTAITPGKGLVVLADGVDAFIAINELSTEKISKIEDFFAVGDEFKAMVIDVNKNAWILKLSIRTLKEKEAKAEFEKYMNEQQDDSKGATLGDLFGGILKK